MANLIITVIAILLVATSATMAAYYGGSALQSGHSGAIASTVMSQSQQLSNAWQGYINNNLDVAPTDGAQLYSGGYLNNWPVYPSSSGSTSGNFGIVNVGASSYYAVAIVGIPANGDPSITDPVAAACRHVIQSAMGVAPNEIVAAPLSTLVAGGTNIGTASLGCGFANSVGTAVILYNSLAPITYPQSSPLVVYYKVG